MSGPSYLEVHLCLDKLWERNVSTPSNPKAMMYSVMDGVACPSSGDFDTWPDLPRDIQQKEKALAI